MKKLLFISMIVVLLFGWSAVPAKAAPPEPLYVEKQCGAVAHHCTITHADSPLEFLEGADIEYFDHVMLVEAGFMHEAATIVITSSDGLSTTVGHVSWVFENGEFFGTVVILPGTGDFAGFHANATIGALGGGKYSFTGFYFFAP